MCVYKRGAFYTCSTYAGIALRIRIVLDTKRSAALPIRQTLEHSYNNAKHHVVWVRVCRYMKLNIHTYIYIYVYMEMYVFVVVFKMFCDNPHTSIYPAASCPLCQNNTFSVYRSEKAAYGSRRMRLTARYAFLTCAPSDSSNGNGKL